MRLPLLLLALSACASPPGGELRQGAYRPPPAVRPGHGAPVVGQPGATRTEPPRSPHARVLPPSREPGLWAGDEPRAGPKRTPAPPLIWDVPVPLPENAVSEADEAFARTCAVTLNQALRTSGMLQGFIKLPAAQHRCVAARLYWECADRMAAAFRADPKEPPAEVFRALSTRDAAQSFVAKECARVTFAHQMTTVLAATTAQWLKEISEHE